MVDLLERIDTLLHQEDLYYGTKDYLNPDFQLQLQSSYDSDTNDDPSVQSSCFSSSTYSSSSSGINEIWREKICEWSYQVIDHFDFSREVVSVSIHFLDRYLSTRPVNKKLFQLAAMTTLYLAIKLYEPGTLSMESMIELSRGYFMVEQMAEMELSILRALGWRVHPPTAYCFAKHILFLLPYSSVSMDIRHDTLELSRFLSELSVIDYYFVTFKPSSVALAALLNAMEAIPGVSDEAQVDFERELQRVPGLDPHQQDVTECRERLRLLYAQGGYSRPEVEGTAAEARGETISPVCVSYGVNVVQQRQQEQQQGLLHHQQSIVPPSGRMAPSVEAQQEKLQQQQLPMDYQYQHAR